MAFGGVQPGDYKKILLYNKDRIFAFVNAFGDVGTEWAVRCRRLCKLGIPHAWRTRTFPKFSPRVSVPMNMWWPMCPMMRVCQKSVEIRGLKVTVSEIKIPLCLRSCL